MRRSCFLFASLVLLTLAAAASAPRDFHSLEQKAEVLRGLRFKTPVPIRMVDPKTLRGVLDDQMRKETSDAEWTPMEKSLKAFGLIPPKMNLKAVLKGLLEDQVVGLYDPDQKKLYVSDQPLDGADLLEGLGGEGFNLSDVYIIHEMVHALTDQYFDLNSMPINDKNDEDRASAARCVVEGDATWVMLRYLYQALQIQPEQQKQATDLMLGMTMGKEILGSSIPDYLQENLLVAYLGGMNLVKAAYDRGGFQAVNRLYTHPPQSMEQVLHPDKYFAGSDPPLRVTVVPPKAFAAGGFKSLASGTWGEFNVQIILKEWGVDDATATKAAEDWGGDRYTVFEGPAGELAFAWATLWDTPEAAARFARALKAIKGVTVARDGNGVTVVKGAPAAEGAGKVSAPAQKAA